MTEKVYRLKHIDCANCAAKIEAKYNALPEVESAVITFALMQLRLKAEDPDALIPKLTQIARTVEPEAEILPREHGHKHHEHHEHHHHEGCSCGHEHHEHHHHEGCSCGHDHHEHHHHEGCACGHDRHEHNHDHHDHAEHDHGHTHSHGSGEGKSILFGAVLFALALMLPKILPAAGFAVLPLCLAAYLILGWNVLKTAGKNLIKGHVLDENFLMSIATLGAFVIGDFPEAVGVMLFYRVGEWFEEKAVARSRSQIMEAIDLRPEVVNRLRGGAVEVIPAADAQVGDVLVVRPGDRIPLDGVVLSGESRVDTAPITGEPVPVSVKPGSTVISGCVNTSGQLRMQVEKPLQDSMVTRILDAVENAAASKPKIDKFITKFARVYTPIVVAAAVLVAIVPSVLTGDWNYWVYTALSFLVMSCPCALVLSVPLAFFCGIGAGSRRGILFKGGVSMEVMAQIRAIAMDKTGTLTWGDFSVQETDLSTEDLILCTSVEQGSNHPIAASVVAFAAEKGLRPLPSESLQEVSGRGLQARVDGKTVLCGNERLLAEQGVEFPPYTGGDTCVLVAVDGVYKGYLRIADTLKDSAGEAVAELNRQGLVTAMLTGDGTQTADAVGRKLGVQEVHSRLLPEDKLAVLQSLRSRHGKVMFVGDGINDAPVLAGSDVGAAMGSGADAAIEAADVVFMTGDPEAIGESLRLAKGTRSIAWQNVYFALAIKTIVMVLGLLGHASMWMAVFADSGVAMLCVLNSVRLLYRRKNK